MVILIKLAEGRKILRILIFGTSRVGGTNEKINAMYNFLSIDNDVTVLRFPGNSYFSKLWYLYQMGSLKIAGKEKKRMLSIASYLEKIIIKEKYDAVIGVETFWSYVLTKDLPCLKIFSCESLEAEEIYFSSSKNKLERFEAMREMETQIMECSSYVIFPWETTEKYARRYVFNGKNFLTIKHGCYPKSVAPSYVFPFSLISLGSLWGEWTNKELLSELTKKSPYIIDVYGNYKPPKKYHLNYCGYANSTNVLTKYNFGVNTISKDPFRCSHFASRILNYLAYGLPVLSPDWMQLSHELGGCLPFNEENFVDIINQNSDKEAWQRLSKKASNQAKELDWSKTLKPLKSIILR